MGDDKGQMNTEAGRETPKGVDVDVAATTMEGSMRVLTSSSNSSSGSSTPRPNTPSETWKDGAGAAGRHPGGPISREHMAILMGLQGVGGNDQPVTPLSTRRMARRLLDGNGGGRGGVGGGGVAAADVLKRYSTPPQGSTHYFGRGGPSSMAEGTRHCWGLVPTKVFFVLVTAAIPASALLLVLLLGYVSYAAHCHRLRMVTEGAADVLLTDPSMEQGDPMKGEAVALAEYQRYLEHARALEGEPYLIFVSSLPVLMRAWRDYVAGLGDGSIRGAGPVGWTASDFPSPTNPFFVVRPLPASVIKANPSSSSMSLPSLETLCAVYGPQFLPLDLNDSFLRLPGTLQSSGRRHAPLILHSQPTWFDSLANPDLAYRQFRYAYAMLLEEEEALLQASSSSALHGSSRRSNFVTPSSSPLPPSPSSSSSSASSPSSSSLEAFPFEPWIAIFQGLLLFGVAERILIAYGSVGGLHAFAAKFPLKAERSLLKRYLATFNAETAASFSKKSVIVAAPSQPIGAPNSSFQLVPGHILHPSVTDLIEDQWDRRFRR